MDYTTLGRTELKVSVAGLGCGGFSRLGLNTGGTETSAIAIIHAALDQGVNLLDTAAPYDTEGVVGKAIKSVPRDRVVITTKSSVMRGGDRWTPERVVASLDNSLRELGIDCIDVFQLHAVPPSGYDYVRDVIAPVLLKEREKGKFRFLGITETSPNDLEHQMLLRAIPDGIWDVVMVAFHLMSQNTREAVFPATLQHRVGTLLMFAVRSIFARARARGRGDEGAGGAGQGAAVAGRRPRSARLPDPSRRRHQPDRCGVSLCAARARRGCRAVRHRRSGASALEHRIDPAAAVAAGGPRQAEVAVQPSARRRPGVAAAPTRRNEGSNVMKLAKIEDLHCDAGWRTFSFLKLTTDDGLVGWSEYTEADGSRGLTAVIRGLAEPLIGLDPRPVQQIASMLWVRQVQAPGGVNSRAIAAIENALLDIKGKALGVPVYELFGGPVRERIPVYWSHCGSYRVRNHELVGVPPLRTYDDIAALGAEVKRRGFKALKTNILPFDGEKLTNFGPGFGRSPGWPELNVDRKTLQAVRDLLGAFRAGAGPEMGLHLDVNYHFKTEGYLQIAKAVAPFDMTWLEIDTWDPQSLALIRRAAPCPIASLESVCGRRAFRPFFDAYATDVAIIDVIWNGFLESIKIAVDGRGV